MSELDKTIEELELEVNAELEEAKQPTDGATKGDSKAEKVDGEVQDLGPAVTSPEDKDSAGGKAADAAKEVKGDKQKKGAKDAGGDTEATKIKEPLAAGDQVDHEGEELEEARMTKEAMTAAMVEKLSGMKAVELKAAYESMMSDDEEEEGDEEEVDESTLEDRLAGVDVSEDVNALTEGEELSEEFKDKAATIFEAAVKSKLRSEVKRIESEKAQEVAEEVESVKAELTEKVDNYMNYVVEEWMKENEIAIERGLKGEIAEDFITGLKALFEEHYIDVPDEKYDILEAQSEKIDELESKINESIEKSAELKKQNDELIRESVFAEVASDLADTEVEKFKSLAEDVDFSDKESFTEKLNTLKESYFPKSNTIAESVDSESNNGDESYDTTGAMAAYMTAISKNVKRAKN